MLPEFPEKNYKTLNLILFSLSVSIFSITMLSAVDPRYDKGKQPDEPYEQSAQEQLPGDERVTNNGRNLTLEVHELKNPALLEALSETNPTITEVQIIRGRNPRTGGSNRRPSAANLTLLGEIFPDITVLHLNDLSLTDYEISGLLENFPYLTSLFLNNNCEIRSLKKFSNANFAKSLRTLNLNQTRIDPSQDAATLKRFFPEATITYGLYEKTQSNTKQSRAKKLIKKIVKKSAEKTLRNPKRKQSSVANNNASSTSLSSSLSGEAYSEQELQEKIALEKETSQVIADAFKEYSLDPTDKLRLALRDLLKKQCRLAENINSSSLALNLGDERKSIAHIAIEQADLNMLELALDIEPTLINSRIYPQNLTLLELASIAKFSNTLRRNFLKVIIKAAVKHKKLDSLLDGIIKAVQTTKDSNLDMLLNELIEIIPSSHIYTLITRLIPLDSRRALRLIDLLAVPRTPAQTTLRIPVHVPNTLHLGTYFGL